MAKQQSFGDKVKKIKNASLMVFCPICQKQTLSAPTLRVLSVKSDDGNVKFVRKRIKYCTSCNKILDAH
ncbi:MAG: hypothetical protein OEM52_06165 [bacterium]|nr:hypothetical protein [bacterium]